MFGCQWTYYLKIYNFLRCNYSKRCLFYPLELTIQEKVWFWYAYMLKDVTRLTITLTDAFEDEQYEYFTVGCVHELHKDISPNLNWFNFHRRKPSWGLALCNMAWENKGRHASLNSFFWTQCPPYCLERQCFRYMYGR